MRIAVLSDIHSNIVALDAVVARLTELGAVGVRGNHDAAAAGGDEIDWFNTDARAAMEWTRKQISTTTRAWLDALPKTRTEQSFTLVHGSPRDPIWEYITSMPVARANISSLTTRYGLHGHTHIPICWREDDGRVEAVSPGDGSSLLLDERPVLLNPGSVGQPRDGDPLASYLVIDTDAGRCNWSRVPYDIAAVQAAMEKQRLPDRLIARLTYGI